MEKYTLTTPTQKITSVKGQTPGLTVAGRVIEEPTTIQAMEITYTDGSRRSTPLCESDDEYREAVTDLLRQ